MQGQVTGSPVRMTATGVVWSSSGDLLGVLTAAATTGTLTLTNENGVTLVNAVALVAGAYLPIPLSFAGPLMATFGGTGIDCTFFVA